MGRMAHLVRAVRLVLFVLVLLGAAPSVTRAEAYGGPDECAAPADAYADDVPLRATAARLRGKAPLKIVVIGGTAALGTAAGSPKLAYPAQLQGVLAERYPDVPVTVVNKSIARQTAKEQVKRLQRDVIAEQPQLVIWETGAYDAVRFVDVDEFVATVQGGIETLHEKKIDVMIMDLQYGKAAQSMIDVERYGDALGWLADVNDAYFFRRFDLMKYWREREVFNYTNPPGKDYQQLAVRVYECLAYRLADAISAAATVTTIGSATD